MVKYFFNIIFSIKQKLTQYVLLIYKLEDLRDITFLRIDGLIIFLTYFCTFD